MEVRFKDLLELVVPERVSNPFEAEPTLVEVEIQESLIDLQSDIAAIECGFSRVVTLTKSRNRTDIPARGDLRLSLSNLEPNIAKLAEEHQPQGSH
ncbi:hypothetical protein M514_10237 [Trichuris suis]|uniref:Uncharacterized protein n=1 Tax=Trichuris suis TaxID=68888 RepID=A0A085LV78_9BILA|nr:hypothetical protein M513_10237 [Trichuris suis]KFD66230.1 hypothetical protein M514_10237 [Trichuris suis]